MKPLVALLLAASATCALAEPNLDQVPAVLHKPLLGNGLQSAQMNDKGVLRLQMGKPQVSELTYSSFIYHSICAEQWRHPEAFAKAQLTRVQLLNADASQGFAFDASGDVCERMGQMGQKYRDLIGPRTSACSASSC